MRRTKYLALAALALLAIPGLSQDSLFQRSKIVYYNTLSAGVLLGDSPLGATGTFGLVNGIRYDRTHVAIGIGYDDYLRENSDSFVQQGFNRWRVMPVFLSLGYDVASVGTNSFYVQLNGGYSKVWDKSEGLYYRFTDIKGGMMMSPMFGYRIAADKYNISLAAGYKWQTNEFAYSFGDWGGANVIEVKETMERFVVQIGIGLH